MLHSRNAVHPCILVDFTVKARPVHGGVRDADQTDGYYGRVGDVRCGGAPRVVLRLASPAPPAPTSSWGSSIRRAAPGVLRAEPALHRPAGLASSVADGRRCSPCSAARS